MAPFSWIWRLESDFFSFHWRLSKLSSFLKNQTSKQNKVSTDLSTSLLNFGIKTQDLPNCLFNFFAWVVFFLGFWKPPTSPFSPPGNSSPTTAVQRSNVRTKAGLLRRGWKASVRPARFRRSLRGVEGSIPPWKTSIETFFQRNWKQNE